MVTYVYKESRPANKGPGGNSQEPDERNPPVNQEQHSALCESEHDVLEAMTKVSWLLMDDDQRDQFMREVVLPRYMSVTSDGVQLGPTWWANNTGATSNAIQKRVERLRNRAIGTDDTTSGPGSAAEQKHVASARSAIKKHPELAERLLEDPEVADQVLAAASKQLADKRNEMRRERGPRRPQTTPLDGAVVVSELAALNAKLDTITDAFDARTIEGRAARMYVHVAQAALSALDLMGDFDDE